MIVITYGESLKYISCPRTDEEAHRQVSRFLRLGIEHRVEFY